MLWPSTPRSYELAAALADVLLDFLDTGFLGVDSDLLLVVSFFASGFTEA